MEAFSTPRVNQQYLDSFTNQTVRLVGKVVQLRGEEATIDSNGMVTCFLTRVSLNPSDRIFRAPGAWVRACITLKTEAQMRRADGGRAQYGRARDYVGAAANDS